METPSLESRRDSSTETPRLDLEGRGREHNTPSLQARAGMVERSTEAPPLAPGFGAVWWREKHGASTTLPSPS